MCFSVGPAARRRARKAFALLRVAIEHLSEHRLRCADTLRSQLMSGSTYTSRETSKCVSLGRGLSTVGVAASVVAGVFRSGSHSADSKLRNRSVGNAWRRSTKPLKYLERQLFKWRPVTRGKAAARNAAVSGLSANSERRSVCTREKMGVGKDEVSAGAREAAVLALGRGMNVPLLGTVGVSASCRGMAVSGDCLGKVENVSRSQERTSMESGRSDPREARPTPLPMTGQRMTLELPVPSHHPWDGGPRPRRWRSRTSSAISGRRAIRSMKRRERGVGSRDICRKS